MTRVTPTLHVVRRGGANYMSQIWEAARAEERMIVALKAGGWMWDPELGAWIHPDVPGVEITR